MSKRLTVEELRKRANAAIRKLESAQSDFTKLKRSFGRLSAEERSSLAGSLEDASEDFSDLVDWYIAKEGSLRPGAKETTLKDVHPALREMIGLGLASVLIRSLTRDPPEQAREGDGERFDYPDATDIQKLNKPKLLTEKTHG